MENTFQFNAMAEAIQFLQTHQKEQPNLEKIAKHVHLSKFHFQRLFKKWVGISPKEFLQYITVEQAKLSLQQGRSTLNTAYQVGLSSNGRLHDLFIKLEACTPGEFKKRGEGVLINFDEIETPFGNALIAETKKGINKLLFTTNFHDEEYTLKNEFPNANFKRGLGENGILAKQYFKDWKFPNQKIGLDLKGTAFQIQVWKALLQIPSARLLSYRDIAHLIDRPKAVRAIGTAIGKNPIAYLIPCHRVIQNNGVMGNYRWNKERKTMINGYEKICLNN